MKTIHTPGPWLLVEQGDANEYAVLTPDKKEWVIAFRLNPGRPIYAQEKANAKLIAAAPEMLESEIKNLEFLRWITTQLSSFNMYSDKRELLYQRIAATEEAIKKATE